VDKADCVLFVYDLSAEADPLEEAAQFFKPLPEAHKLILVANKCDVMPGQKAGPRHRSGPAGQDYREMVLSAQRGEGLSELRDTLKAQMGFQAAGGGVFTARRRHLDALASARAAVLVARQQLLERGAGELVAEDLRVAQNALAEITGEFSSDDLLGRIFSSFCIGK
jgi:tRNA modification GTPase